jgi:ribosomal protein S8
LFEAQDQYVAQLIAELDEEGFVEFLEVLDQRNAEVELKKKKDRCLKVFVEINQKAMIHWAMLVAEEEEKKAQDILNSHY